MLIPIDLHKNIKVITLFLIILVIPAIFYQTSITMIETWKSNDSFSHGFFIFPISLWLIFQKRDHINSQNISPEPKALVLLIAFLSSWFLSKLVDVQLVQQFSVIFLILTTIWILFGRLFLLSLAFPLSYLFLSVPMGDSLVPPMMEFTADFTVGAIKFFGIPVYRDGLLFSLPTGSWSVIEACSGVRYIISSFTLGTLYAYITYHSNTKRISFVIIALIVSVIANGLRALGIVMIGHFSNMKYGTGGDHTFYGWLFYGFIILSLFYFGTYWADKPSETREHSAPDKSTQFLPLKSGAIIICLLVSVQLIIYKITNTENGNQEIITVTIPNNFSGWQSIDENFFGWQPQITNPDTKVLRTFQFGQDHVQLALGFYQNQKQGSEAVSTENQLDNESENWKATGKSTDLKIADYYVSETELSYRDQKILVWNWYLVGDTETPNPYIAKIINVANIILYQRNDASYITLATPVIKDKKISRQQLEDFMNEAHGALLKALTLNVEF
jgi:exosortase A